MRIAMTGSTGLIGSQLSGLLSAEGHEVIGMARRGGRPRPGETVDWDPASGVVDTAGLRGLGAVVHLAGESIAGEHILGSRWTSERKRRILDSRSRGTRAIAEAMATMTDGPRVLVCASAIGIYGDRGDEVLTEDSGPGQGFLAEVVQAWEAAAYPAREVGVRVVHVRIGIVQTPKGGALGRQLPLFKIAGAARLGSGRQYVSWVTLDDVAGVLRHALVTDSLHGVINATAPAPVTNAEYTRTLARVLRRPVLPIGVPAWAPGLVLGRELVDELLYYSARVLPERTQASGYAFTEPDLEAALRRMLAR
ncbi:MAG: TIGR01777 family oxidoreductase [Actinomycetota bacterium]|nr:TIGR01777 family oxidoreductase [Actinomycetota bacterium]